MSRFVSPVVIQKACPIQEIGVACKLQVYLRRVLTEYLVLRADLNKLMDPILAKFKVKKVAMWIGEDKKTGRMSLIEEPSEDDVAKGRAFYARYVRGRRKPCFVKGYINNRLSTTFPEVDATIANCLLVGLLKSL